MLPGAHLVSVTLLDQAATHEGAQDALPHAPLHSGKGLRVKPARGMKHHASGSARVISVAVRLEYPIDDAAVKVAWREAQSQARKAHMLVQGRAETVNEGHRTDAGLFAASGTVLPQATFHHAQEDAQDSPLQGRVRL